MGAPEKGMEATERPAAETLLTALRTIKVAERQRHETVLDYWLSIRGDKEFPPLHDLDPLEISDAGPDSVLLELIGGGQDAEIRHLGDALKDDISVDRIIDAPNPSVLSCIAKKLPIVAISRDFLAFEDSFDSAGGWTRLWVTLLPLSSCGSWVDYVYALVSVERGGGKAAKPVEAPPAEEAVAEDAPAPAEELVDKQVEASGLEPEGAEEPAAEETEPAVAKPDGVEDVVPFVAEEPEAVPEAAAEPVEPEEPESEPEAVGDPIETEEPESDAVAEPEMLADASLEPEHAAEPEVEDQPDPEVDTEAASEETAGPSGPGFSKLLEGIANLAGFYGQGVRVEDPVVQADLPPSEPAVPEPESSEAPVDEPEPIELTDQLEEPAQEPASDVEPQPAPAMEGTLQSKLTEVRAKADEAQQARLRAVSALHEGLSAAYDFALDAETSPEEYLKLVEAQGLKIQLRAPMAPVARLAFGDSCDDATLAQLEKTLAWALKEELPRGTLIERIQKAGGIAELLKAA
jgi:hypothetical protein